MEGFGLTIFIYTLNVMQEIDLKVPYEYKARDYQQPFWRAAKTGVKRFCLIWHRRAGKEVTCWNYMIKEAMKKVGTYYYFFPHFSQGRKVLWDGANKDGFKFLDYIPRELLFGHPNASEMKIWLKDLDGRKGSLIQIVGTNNYDSIMGTNPIGCVFSEYSLQDPNAWQLIRPILAENGGWAIFNFTPRGLNHAKELYDMALTNDQWFCQRLTADDTNAITSEQIDEERKAGMSEDYIQQEFYCSFTLGIEGSYYGKYILDSRNEGRIGNVRYDPSVPVHVAMDIGFGDSTAIVFYQLVGLEVHVVDYYEAQGLPFYHYAQVIQDRKYIYGKYFAPSDADAHHISTGLSVKEVASALGLDLTILPSAHLPLENGIEAVRSIFKNIWIDEKKCEKLIKALENYIKIYDEKNSVYKNRPLHNWASHGADAFRYMAIAIKLWGHGQKGVDDKEYEKMKNKYLPRFS